jgi:lantibiotic modifying enzyme
LLEELYHRVNGWLRKDTTVFARRLAPGIGMAESPSPVASFGAHRCGIVADALIQAREEGRESVSERLQAIKDAFREHGLSFEAPHLNPGSRDEYEFSLRASPSPGGDPAIPGIIHSRAGRRSDREQFLDAAVAIGQLLADRAVWHEGRCNWMGLALSPDSAAAGSSILTYRSLGPDLYSGTSGVALFLAELHTAAGGGKIRRTAIGAARQALSRVFRPSPAGQPGLFTGDLGEICAAARIGWALGVDEFLERAAGLLQTSSRRIEENGHSDLISGHAGAILGLLMLERISPALAPPGLATLLGDALLNRAQRKHALCSWPSPSFPNQRPLTGLSHGAAGIGWALLELSQSTGIPRFREAAEMAFNYERAWFDEKAGNWADLRGISGRKRAPGHPLSFQVSWCHGAPGIALSRLRAHEAWGGERWKREALAALETTLAWTRQMLGVEGTNFCLCHGLAGNAHILIKGSEALGSALPGAGELSREVAAAGISRYASRGHRWPLGALGERSPGLMCGLSGVGYFYLSLSDPTVPSILSGGLHQKGQRSSSPATSMHGDRA